MSDGKPPDWAERQKTDGKDATREAFEAEGEPMPGPGEETEADAKARRAEGFHRAAPPVGDLFAGAVDLMLRRADGTAKKVPMPWPAVNEALGGGLWPGLHVLTGGTGDGKSQWALQVALHAARAHVPTLYIGLELGHADMVARLLGLMLADDGQAPRGVKWSDLYLGKNRDALTYARERYGRAMAELPLWLEVGPPYGWTADLLRERALALREQFPEKDGPGSLPMLVVLDYLQVIASPPKVRQELRERIGQAAYQGRAVARDLDAAVLMLSSISREGAGTIRSEREKEKGYEGLGNGDPGRLVGLGKESGEIEFSADTVMALCQGGFEKDHTEMHLAVAKVRAGTRGWQRLDFNGGWFSADKATGKITEL